MSEPVSDYAKELREVKFTLKRRNKELGRAGETIYRLRADIALIREKDPKVATSLYLQQRRENDELRKLISSLRKENNDLRHYRNYRTSDVWEKLSSRKDIA